MQMWLFVLAFIALFVINVYTTGPRGDSERIQYLAGIKYRLDKPYRLKVKLNSDNIVCRHVSYTDGELLIDREFVWDGVTGMWINESAAMRGSLVHDAIYHLIRECGIDDSNAKIADDLLYQFSREDGVSWTLAQIMHYTTKYLGPYGRDPKFNQRAHYIA